MSLLLLGNKKKKDIVKNGLVLWLDGKDFTNSPPTSQLRDRSGNGNNATPIGMAYTTSSGSDGSNGIVLDGVNDCLTVPNNSAFDFKGENFTILFNVNLKAINDIQGFLCKRLSYLSNNSVDFRYTSVGTINFIYTTNGTAGINLSFPYILLINTNYNICLKREGEILSLFINGIFIISKTMGTDIIFTSPENVLIGALNTDGNKVYPLNGTLKNMLIYKNKALTDAEIKQNYNASK